MACGFRKVTRSSGRRWSIFVGDPNLPQSSRQRLLYSESCTERPNRSIVTVVESKSMWKPHCIKTTVQRFQLQNLSIHRYWWDSIHFHDITTWNDLDLDDLDIIPCVFGHLSAVQLQVRHAASTSGPKLLDCTIRGASFWNRLLCGSVARGTCYPPSSEQKTDAAPWAKCLTIHFWQRLCRFRNVLMCFSSHISNLRAEKYYTRVMYRVIQCYTYIIHTSMYSARLV